MCVRCRVYAPLSAAWTCCSMDCHVFTKRNPSPPCHAPHGHIWWRLPLTHPPTHQRPCSPPLHILLCNLWETPSGCMRLLQPTHPHCPHPDLHIFTHRIIYGLIYRALRGTGIFYWLWNHSGTNAGNTEGGEERGNTIIPNVVINTWLTVNYAPCSEAPNLITLVIISLASPSHMLH